MVRPWVASLDRRPGLPFYLVAGSLVALAAAHFHTGATGTMTDAIESALVAVMAVSPVVVGWQVDVDEFGAEAALRACGLATLGGVFGGAVGGVVVGLALIEGSANPEPGVVLLVGVAAGTALGAPIGYYYEGFKHRNVELRRQYERAETLNKRLHITQRVLRHNLRNELTVLYGTADTVADRTKALDDECEDAVEMLQTHLDHLAELSENTRRLSHVWETDERREMDVGEVTTHYVAEFRERYPTVEFDDSVTSEGACVHPDVGFAIREALQNAVDHNDAEHLTVEVGVTADDGTVTVTVADDGSGIPRLETRALEQVEEKPLSHGRGLGLWVIYWTVEKSGGDLRFEDNDPGTVVRMTLSATC